MFKKNAEKTKLDEAIENALEYLDVYDDNYFKYVEAIEKLHRMKDNEKSRRQVSPDTIAIIAGNLAGIIIIVGHERAHVVTSKALGFLRQLR